jgi:hypothetical protein
MVNEAGAFLVHHLNCTEWRHEYEIRLQHYVLVSESTLGGII